MYGIIKSGVNLPIAFRSWYLYANPKLGYGSQHSWIVKLSANREKPRFVITGFTLNGELITNNLSNLKVYLNSESYPYDNLNVDVSKNQYAHLYEMYTRFQSCNYNRETHPFLTANEFKLKVPIIVVDLSYQNESQNFLERWTKQFSTNAKVSRDNNKRRSFLLGFFLFLY